MNLSLSLELATSRAAEASFGQNSHSPARIRQLNALPSQLYSRSKELDPVYFDYQCSQLDKATGSAIDVGSFVETLSLRSRITCRSRTVLQTLSLISSDV